MRIAIAILGAALAFGCKGKTKAPEPEKPQPEQPQPEKADPPQPAAGSGNVLDIPKLTGSGPVKTTKPLDKAQYDKMSKLDQVGWDKEIRYANDKGLEVRYRTKAHPTLSVHIVAWPCFDCIPPAELPKWKAKEAALKNLLLPELRDRKDTLFEIGQTKLAGAPIIYTYQLAHGFGPGENNNQQGPYSNAYTAYHNDGINQIRVTAQYADAPVATRDELVNLAPREDLERIALAFLDVYTHAW